MKKIIQDAERLLKNAGYIAPTVVNIVGSGLPITKAVVAFAANDEGEVIGFSVAVGIVESDVSPNSPFLEDGVRLLEGKFGTSSNYLLLKTGLFEAKGRDLRPLAGGILPLEKSHAVWHIFEPELMSRIIRDEFQEQKRTRGFVNYTDSLAKLSTNDDLMFDGQRITLSRGLLFALWKQIARSDPNSGAVFWSTSPDLNSALADIALTGESPSSIFDPFLGVGDTLVHVASRLSGLFNFYGWEVNKDVFANASVFLNTGQEYGAYSIRLDEANVELRCVDSFSETWPKVDLLISSPPIGIRLSEPCLGPSFVTRDGEVAAIDKAIEALNIGGRAVLLTSRGWTFKSGDSAKLREMISRRDDINVTAIIGLPSVMPGTSLEPCIVVIDRIPKAETLVAELGADWKEQLQRGGPIWAELRGPSDA